MRRRFALLFWLASCLLFWSAVGCHREAGPPPPLAAEQLPAEMAKAFSQANPQVKEIASQVVTAVQNKDYAGAYQGVQILCGSGEATKEQRLLAARAMLTITSLLQAAQAQGDAGAAAALKLHRSTR